MNCKNKLFIVLFLSFIIINIFYVFNFCVYAVDKTIDPDEYKVSGNGGSDENVLTDKGGKIIGAVQLIGSIASVLALSLLGIKFMLGSAEEKADYKQWMIYYVVGAILVFAISNISAAIYGAINPINS